MFTSSPSLNPLKIEKLLKYKLTAIKKTRSWVTVDQDFNTFLGDRKVVTNKLDERSHSPEEA